MVETSRPAIPTEELETIITDSSTEGRREFNENTLNYWREHHKKDLEELRTTPTVGKFNLLVTQAENTIQYQTEYNRNLDIEGSFNYGAETAFLMRNEILRAALYSRTEEEGIDSPLAEMLLQHYLLTLQDVNSYRYKKESASSEEWARLRAELLGNCALLGTHFPEEFERSVQDTRNILKARTKGHISPTWRKIAERDKKTFLYTRAGIRAEIRAWWMLSLGLDELGKDYSLEHADSETDMQGIADFFVYKEEEGQKVVQFGVEVKSENGEYIELDLITGEPMEEQDHFEQETPQNAQEFASRTGIPIISLRIPRGINGKPLNPREVFTSEDDRDIILYALKQGIKSRQKGEKGS